MYSNEQQQTLAQHPRKLEFFAVSHVQHGTTIAARLCMNMLGEYKKVELIWANGECQYATAKQYEKNFRAI